MHWCFWFKTRLYAHSRAVSYAGRAPQQQAQQQARPPPLARERATQLLKTLERFYGVKALADNKQRLPLAFR